MLHFLTHDIKSFEDEKNLQRNRRWEFVDTARFISHNNGENKALII